MTVVAPSDPCQIVCACGDTFAGSQRGDIIRAVQPLQGQVNMAALCLCLAENVLCCPTGPAA